MDTRRFRPFSRLTMLGLVLMVVANTVRFILERHTTLGEQITDPVVGFFYGVGIATLILGVWRQGRGTRRCAQ